MLQGCGLAELGGSVRETGDVEGRGADGSRKGKKLSNTKFNMQVLVNSIILQFAVQNSVCILICKLP